MPLPTGGDTRIETRKKEKIKIKEPEEYRVILLNDHFTTMEFVVEVLMLIFHKDRSKAEQIMFEVHRIGRGVAGQYPRDIAQTKVKQVHDLARQYEFPLKCIIEPI
ncbi:MAG: ATP-dependent Clp protease adapter ClpS [Spirochaetaceae bacterium]|nr:ATP-dependent Clp protease adapter ClpS [Spirochaetaceae bacterium]